MKKLFKKSLAAIMCIVLFVACFTTTVSAASYPALFLDTALWGVDADLYAGDYIPLKFTYFPEYKNERIVVEIYNSEGTLIADSDRTFYHTDLMLEYTVNWDTTGYTPGEYKVVVTKHFYTFYSWHTAPTQDKYWIDLQDPASRPTNGWYAKNGKWSYYRNSRKVTDEWVLDSTGWCYLGEDGYMVYNSWVQDSYGWCFVGSDGYMVYNNWVHDGKGWCYIGADGYMKGNMWMADSTGWCYLGADGYMVTNNWIKDSTGWCYLGNDGYMVYNKWVRDSHGWCYVGSAGYMVTNTWVQDSKGWCYIGADGYAVTNCWKRDSYGWCYLDSEGSMVKNNWIIDGGNRYYLDSNGYRVTGTMVINGRTYTFDSNGVCINY